MNFCCQKYSLSFPRAQPVLPQGRTAIFVADASVFGVFTAGCNFSHLKGEELTVIHLYKNALHNSREPSLDKPTKRNYTTNREGAVRNGQLLPVRSIRMTATVWRLGRSFLIVMDLFEDCPCDLKCNSNCAANNDEQLQNIVQHHDASPLPRLRTGEQTISFYVPRTLAGGKHDHLRLQTAPNHRLFRRYF